MLPFWVLMCSCALMCDPIMVCSEYNLLAHKDMRVIQYITRSKISSYSPYVNAFGHCMNIEWTSWTWPWVEARSPGLGIWPRPKSGALFPATGRDWTPCPGHWPRSDQWPRRRPTGLGRRSSLIHRDLSLDFICDGFKCHNRVSGMGSIVWWCVVPPECSHVYSPNTTPWSIIHCCTKCNRPFFKFHFKWLNWPWACSWCFGTENYIYTLTVQVVHLR